jgi:hypothetical protein
MNEKQRERRRRFAAIKRRQLEREERRNKAHRADAVVVKNPRGPALGDPSRNLHIRCPNHQMFTGGTFKVEHFRDGEKIGEYECKNGIVNQGLNDVLGVQFDAVTQKTQWYIGLINLTGFTALAATDTYDDIDQAGNGWDTFQSYTDANNGNSATTRPAWTTDAPSGQSITNSTQAIYDITASGTVKGIFVVAGQNAQTKGDHSPGATPPNILWATALFSGGDVAVSNTDQLKVTYTVNASTT